MPEKEPRKVCFLICLIGKEGSETRDRSDSIQKHILEPVLKANGYVARADQISEPGTITAQIVERLVEDDLVIADMTDHNPNVFYELAIRHAYKKHVIHFISSDQKIPFDVAGMRAIPLEYTDIGSVREFEKELDKQLKAIESGIAIDNPIISATDLTVLRQSDDEQQRALAKILDKLEHMEHRFPAQPIAQSTSQIDVSDLWEWEGELDEIISQTVNTDIYEDDQDGMMAEHVASDITSWKRKIFRELERFTK